MKIISGGQTGVDRGALDAAMALGFEVGGWCPRGRRAEDGVIPSAYDFLVEATSRDYRQRTEWNVRDADVTVILFDGITLGRGSWLTHRLCTEMDKPFIVAEANLSATSCVRAAVRFLSKHSPDVVNVAGSRASTSPGIQERTRFFMGEVLTRFREKK